MVRTKADSCPASGRKVVAARAPRKAVGASSSAGSSSSAAPGASPAGKYAGGNPVCPRPTPDWQKGIGTFFNRMPGNEENQEPDENAGCSGSSGGSEGAGGSASSTKSSSCPGPSGSGNSTAGSSKDPEEEES